MACSNVGVELLEQAFERRRSVSSLLSVVGCPSYTRPFEAQRHRSPPGGFFEADIVEMRLLEPHRRMLSLGRLVLVQDILDIVGGQRPGAGWRVAVPRSSRA